MSNKDLLHSLILSLSKGEKSYFKKYVAGTGDKLNKIYLQLFDAMAAEKIYIEAEFKKQHSGKAFIRQFAFSKNYLFNLIIKSLKQHQQKTDVDTLVYNLILESNVLTRKAFYKEASKRLLKALELTQRHEKFALSLEIYLMMHRFIINRSAFYKNDQPFQIVEQIKKLLVQINELNEYRKLSYENWSIFYSRQSYLIKEIEIEKVSNNALLADQTLPYTLMSRILYHNIRGSIFEWYKKDKHLVRKEKIKSLKLFEENPNFAKEERGLYLAAVSNYLCDASDEYDDKEVLHYFNVLSGFSALYPEEKLRIFEKEVMLKLGYYIKTLKFEEGLKYARSIVTELEKQEHLMNEDFLLASYDNMSIIFFGNQLLSQATFYVNKIIHHHGALRSDIKCFSHLFYLIIQYEKGDIDHLEYQLKYTEKFVKQHKGLNEYEQKVLLFFHSVINMESNNEEMALLNSLLTELLKEYKSNYNTQLVFEYFNVIDWVKAKINRIPYLTQIVQYGYTRL